MTTKVYAAFRSVPDYHGPPPTLLSLHESYDGAVKALYPNSEKFQNAFRPLRMNEWQGPDGFGIVRVLEILP